MTALYAAGVLSLKDFVRIARKRGELMAEAAKNPGAMLAVAESVEKVIAHLKTIDVGDVVVANHNSPTQVVLSGPTADIDAVEKKLVGFKTKRLPVATAFHSKIVSGSSFLQSKSSEQKLIKKASSEADY